LVVDRNHVEGKAFGRFVEHALRLLGFLEQFVDLRQGRDAGHQALAEQARDLVEHHEAARVGDHDDETVFQLFDRHEVVAEHHLDRHGEEQVVLDAEVLEVDKLAAVAPREHLRVGLLVQFDWAAKMEFETTGASAMESVALLFHASTLSRFTFPQQTNP
jgi:hypothetical protein